MRQIFSVRFFAAVGAVALLLLALGTFFTARGVIDEAIDDDTATSVPQPRQIDLVDVVASTSNPGFGVGPDGMASGDGQLMLDPSRQVTVRSGTPGVDECHRVAESGACAVLADLLGEGVVWFALVPMGAGRTVDLPAIDTLDGGIATLVNGWQLAHAPALDRRCPDPDGEGDEVFESYRQFKQVFGADFVTVYDIDARQLTAVRCRERVAYAPPTSTPPTSTPFLSAICGRPAADC